MALNKSIKDKSKNALRIKSILIVSLISVCLSNITVCEAKEAAGEVCKNLGKVNNIDELLFQFYSNIDDQCLFEMPTQELEKIWGVRVLDCINCSNDEWNVFSIEDRRIRESEEGFFVSKKNFEQGIPAFHVSLTNKYIDKNKGWGDSVGRGEFPKLLPPPEIVNYFFDSPYTIRSHVNVSWPTMPKDNVYHNYSQYYWLNKENLDEQPVLFFKTDFFPLPSSMVLYSQARALDFK